MKTDIIFSEDEKEFVILNYIDKVELVNPIEHIEECEIQQIISHIKGYLFFMAGRVSEEWYRNKAEEERNKIPDEKRWLNIILNTKVNENYIRLIQAEKKRDQEKLLEGLSITTNEMMNLFCIAYKDYGFLYSFYTFEVLPKGYENRKLPTVANYSNGKVNKLGDMDLTDGEIKQLIENRKVICAHFIEKENIWHCFLFTYRSMKGQEKWKGGQAHLHYASSSTFFREKEDFLKQLEQGKYEGTLSMHIPILDYGNQTINLQSPYSNEK